MEEILSGKSEVLIKKAAKMFEIKRRNKIKFNTGKKFFSPGCNFDLNKSAKVFPVMNECNKI